MNYNIEDKILLIFKSEKLIERICLDDCFGFLAEKSQLQVTVTQYTLDKNGQRKKKIHQLQIENEETFQKLQGGLSF